MKITHKSALSLLDCLYRVGGISRTVYGDYCVCQEEGWTAISPKEAAEDLAARLDEVDMIMSRIAELGGEAPMPDLEVDGVTLYFNWETALGEPQAWAYLNDGTSIEITHEEDGLSKEEQFFSIRHHCSEKDFDGDVYHSTMGVIAQHSGGLADIDEMLTRLVSEIGIKPEEKREVYKPSVSDKHCKMLLLDEFKRLVNSLYDEEVYVDADLEGITVGLTEDDLPAEDLHERLAKALGVKGITSIHIDDYEPCGVWLVLENKPKKVGHWIASVEGDKPVQVCSHCCASFPLAYADGGHPYCPSCGAEMRLGSTETGISRLVNENYPEILDRDGSFNEGLLTFNIGFFNPAIKGSTDAIEGVLDDGVANDETQFSAEDLYELTELYLDFCDENDLPYDTVKYVEITEEE